MDTIITLFAVFSTELSTTTLRQFLQVVLAMLAMTGRGTMLTSLVGHQKTVVNARDNACLIRCCLGHPLLGVFSQTSL